MTVFVMSTDIPKEQNSCISGGETRIKATWTGKIPFLNNSGTSLKKTGIYSALASETASLMFSPKKKAFTVKCRDISGCA